MAEGAGVGVREGKIVLVGVGVVSVSGVRAGIEVLVNVSNIFGVLIGVADGKVSATGVPVGDKSR